MASGIYKYEPLWGEWYVDDLLGKGSYGEVYKIHRDVGGVRIEAAVKYISIPKTEDRKSYRHYTQEELATLFEERADKFAIEISSMLKLRDSQNVVRYEDHIKKAKEDGLGWDIIIRMELLTPLEDYLDEHSFSRKDVAKLGIDICSAIASCQSNDIIHRDIKIENIFVDSHGNYKLGDFGVSKVGSGTATGTITGTEDYMAPEISLEHKYNKTVDIYALGIAMYQLLNNRRKPFIDADSVPGQEAEAQAHFKRMKGEPLPAPKFAGENLAGVILKACAYNKDERYESPMQMAADLRNALESLNDEAVLEPRGRTVNIIGGAGGSTVSEIEKRGGTISEIGAEKGTISEIGGIQKKKKKSKALLFIILGILAVLITAGVLASVFILPGILGEDTASVEEVAVEEITGLPEEGIRMVVGDTYELEAEVVPSDADVEIEYSSKDESVATVDEDGIITAQNAGETVVVAECGDITCDVTVIVTAKKIPVEDISGVASDVLLVVGGSGAQINAAVLPADATVQTFTYTSSNPSVAAVDETGYVTPVAKGTATISVTADGITKKMIVTVQPKQTVTVGGGTSNRGTGGSSGGSTNNNSNTTNNSGGTTSGGGTTPNPSTGGEFDADHDTSLQGAI